MNAERARIAVVIHVGGPVVSDTPFACLPQTADRTSRAPEIETILEPFMDTIFNATLISVHVVHFSVHAPVGRYDVVITKCRVQVASSTTVGMKSVIATFNCLDPCW